MKKLSAYLWLSSKAMWREGFQTLLSRLYWRGEGYQGPHPQLVYPENLDAVASGT